jgi:hypothetical protein
VWVVVQGATPELGLGGGGGGLKLNFSRGPVFPPGEKKPIHSKYTELFGCYTFSVKSNPNLTK